MIIRINKGFQSAGLSFLGPKVKGLRLRQTYLGRSSFGGDKGLLYLCSAVEPVRVGSLRRNDSAYLADRV